MTNDHVPVADLGFPGGGGANSPGGGRQHMISPKFPKNCMKLKEFGPRGGGRASKILLCRSATVYHQIVSANNVFFPDTWKTKKDPKEDHF